MNFYETLGEYEIQTEFFSEGRPVYKRVDRKAAVFLMLPEDSQDWKVLSLSGAKEKMLIVSGRGAVSPTDAGPWQHCTMAQAMEIEGSKVHKSKTQFYVQF